MMAEVNERKERYLARFDEFINQAAKVEPSWLVEIRKQAISRFDEMGFPTPRDEDWRETNINRIIKSDYTPAETVSVSVQDLAAANYSGLDNGPRIVMLNGRFSEELSSLSSLPKGIKVSSLAAVLQTDSAQLEPYFARLGSFETRAFAALNTAFFQDGVFIQVEKNTVVDVPVQVVFVSKTNGTPQITHPRVLLVAGSGSQAKFVETHVGYEGEVYLTNAVSEFICAENSNIEYCKVQRDNEASFHVSNNDITLERNTNFKTHSIAYGAAVARNDYNSTLNGEGIECVLNGLYIIHNEQLTDHRLTVEHAKPHCTSYQLFKGVLSDKAQGVFRGRIHVHQDAQKTDAYQTNQNLLLSKDAEVNTRPQLEIYADDVKCSHGATIGRLNENELFYLQSRGINKEASQSLLIYAFASEIVELIGIEAIHPDLKKLVVSRLPNSEIFED